MSVLPSVIFSLSPFGTIPLMMESLYRYALQAPEEAVGLPGKFSIVKYKMYDIAVNALLFSLRIL